MTPEDLDQLEELLRENGDADEAADFADRVMTAVNETTRLRGQCAAAEIVFQKMRAERDAAEQALTEVGTLRSALHAAESVRDDARRVSQRYLDEKREAFAALTEMQHHLLNLLARIHRDGGHYTEAHGLTKSVADADLRIAELNCLADEDRGAK